MTRHADFATAVEQLLAQAGYVPADAPETLQPGAALVAPAGEGGGRGPTADGYNPIVDIVIGVASTFSSDPRGALLTALDKATALCWESDLLVPLPAQVLIRPTILGAPIGTEDQPLIAIVIRASQG